MYRLSIFAGILAWTDGDILTRRLWSQHLFAEAKKDSFFQKFMAA